MVGYACEKDVRSVIEGRYDLLFLASWTSGSAKRVARSPLAAEAYASCEALESGAYLQMMLDDL